MYRVGVDLGGTNIVAGVINEEMKIIGRGKLKTNCPRATERMLPRHKFSLKTLMQTAVSQSAVLICSIP